MIAYHDEEWGVPVHDDRRLFEFLILEGAQAGLSWSTILNKSANYRRAYDRFDPRKVARYGASDVRRLLADAGIVRNRLKIEPVRSMEEVLPLALARPLAKSSSRKEPPEKAQPSAAGRGSA